MYYYNIHDIIKVKSEITLQELEYFVSKEFEDPDIMLIIRSFSKDPDMSKFRVSRKLITDNFDSQRSQYTIKYTELFGSSGDLFQIKFNGS